MRAIHTLGARRSQLTAHSGTKPAVKDDRRRGEGQLNCPAPLTATDVEL